MGRYVLLSFMMLMNAHAGELYRSIDSNGKVHYSDRPLVNTEDVVELKIDKASNPDESLSYETRHAQQSFPVTLYVFPDNGSITQQARNFLNKRGIPFVEKTLLSQEEFEAFRSASGGSEIPTIKVGMGWLRGFQADQWGKELDLAGYPKNAPYRSPSVAPLSQPAQ